MRFWGLGRKALTAWDLGPCSRNCGLGTINSRRSACHGASLRSAVSRLADAGASEVSMMVAEGQGSIRIAIASRTVTVASETSSPRVRRRRIRSAPTSFSHVQQIARSSVPASCATWTALARCVGADPGCIENDRLALLEMFSSRPEEFVVHGSDGFGRVTIGYQWSLLPDLV